MEKGNYISTILRSKQTILSAKDILLLWGEASSDAARVRINYYAKRGDLYRIRRGFYAKDKDYNKFELATKIFTPSYVSFETVLGQAGITFQHYNQIFVASYTTREITADGQAYSYKRIKDAILTNPAGIENKDNYSIATPERAFLDIVYLNKDYHFDNLGPLNWDKVFEILPAYGGNKRMGKMVKKYREALHKETK
jgi:predicted transcriptional regulator of viral defense system